jgi:hypothetical protein
MAMILDQTSRQNTAILGATATILLFIESAFGQGPMDFALVIGPDATVSLRNLANHEQLFASYVLVGPSELNETGHWNSIANEYFADPDAFTSVFGKLVGQHIISSESHVNTNGRTDFIEFLTLHWPPQFTWPIGKPLGNDVEAIRIAVDSGDIEWFADYCELCADDVPIIFEIPEPATIALALCGIPVLLLLIRCRRRRVAGVE